MSVAPDQPSIAAPSPRPGAADDAAGGFVRRIIRAYYAADVVVIVASLAMVVMALVAMSRIPMWPAVVFTSGAIVTTVTGLAMLHARSPSRLTAFLHDWAFAPIIYVIYIETHWMVGPLHHGWLADPWLIAADRVLFGGDPTAWLARAATPWLTEIAQIAYTLFYALAVTVGAAIYLRRTRADYRRFYFACACGFLASYVGYFFVPAVGPRFTLYDFAALDRELPGLWLTPALREFVNVGGLIPLGAPASITLGLAQRDVFPSGHTLVTLVGIWWSWRMRLGLRWGITVVGVILIFGTVYLRYHYAVDVLASALLAAAGYWLVPRAYEWMVSRLGTRERDEDGRRWVTAA